MPIDPGRIARLEQELAEAKAQLLAEDGERYRILRRQLPQEEWERIVNGLEDPRERVLFGLEPPEERSRTRAAGAAKAGGNQVCPRCGKGGFSERGLKLHITRMHKREGTGEAAASAP